MGILLVLGVLVLAFLCGRLQVTVTHLRKEVTDLSEKVATINENSDVEE